MCKWVQIFDVLMQDGIIKIVLSRFDSAFEWNIWLDVDDYFISLSPAICQVNLVLVVVMATITVIYCSGNICNICNSCLHYNYNDDKEENNNIDCFKYITKDLQSILTTMNCAFEFQNHDIITKVKKRKNDTKNRIIHCNMWMHKKHAK